MVEAVMLTFGSLFAGIGGMDLGLERAGMKCAWQVEIDDYATRVLAKHWPDVPRFRDVRDVGSHNLQPVDLICGGFPCQDISVAGKRAGIDGERSGLWSEYARIVCELRPQYILVENVAALLGRGIGRVLGDLATLGYDAEWSVISACAFGAPHTRERLFIIANSHEVGWRRSRLGNERLDDLRSRLNAWETAPTGKWGDVERWARSIMATGNGIAPAAERSGVDDGIPYRLDRIRGLGNAVVPQVAEYIGRQIMQAAL